MLELGVDTYPYFALDGSSSGIIFPEPRPDRTLDNSLYSLCYLYPNLICCSIHFSFEKLLILLLTFFNLQGEF
jgi:hypothetical protein